MNAAVSRWLWSGIVLIGAISYGILSPVIKMAYEVGLNELQVTFAQLVTGTFLLWGFVALRRQVWDYLFRESWLRVGFIGFIGVLLTSVFINGALMHLPATVSVVLLFQFTWITILLEFLLSGKRPSMLQFTTVIIVLIGTVLAVGLKWSELGDMSLIGFVLGLLSACTYSIFIVFAGRVAPHMDPVLKSAVMMTPFLPVTLLIIWLMYPNQSLVYGDHMLLVQLLGWGILLGLLAHAIPTICFNVGIPRIGSSLAAMIGAAELPAAVIGAFVLIQEKVTPIQWFGIALIVISIMVSERRQAYQQG